MEEQGKAKDPGSMFKQYMNEMEGTWTKMWDQVVASQWYARFQGTLMETILSTHQASQNNIKKYLESLSIPTIEDLARVTQQVIQTEKKIEDLEKELRSLKNIEDKLDTLLALSAKVNAKTMPITTLNETKKAAQKPRRNTAPKPRAKSTPKSTPKSTDKTMDTTVTKPQGDASVEAEKQAKSPQLEEPQLTSPNTKIEQ